MALLPIATVRACVLAEMAAAGAWAERRGRDLAFEEEALSLTLRLSGPAANDPAGQESYLLKGTFHDYRALPPAWWFAHPDNGDDIGPPAYPASPVPHPRGSGLFIQGGPTGALICAHFNRLAYFEGVGTGEERQGAHADWGEPTAWLNLPPTQYTHAETIGDMLARIELEVLESRGRMASLA